VHTFGETDGLASASSISALPAGIPNGFAKVAVQRDALEVRMSSTLEIGRSGEACI
jgi:hypothetical protein